MRLRNRPREIVRENLTSIAKVNRSDRASRLPLCLLKPSALSNRYFRVAGVAKLQFVTAKTEVWRLRLHSPNPNF